MENIPRIGDKIINHEIVRPDSTHPIAENASEPSAQTLNDSEQTLRQNEQNQTQTPQTEQKEYSLAQFKKDYKRILRREVFPKLKPFEKDRKNTHKLLLVIGIPLTIIATLLVLLCSQQIDDYRLVIAPVVLYTMVWHFFKKKLENKIKKQIMPILMQAVPNFKWSLEPAISKYEIEQTDIIPDIDRARDACDDNFSGTYRNVKVYISEHQYKIGSGKNERTIYQGALVKISMNKRFEGVTLIRPKGEKRTKSRLEEVKLEDIKFNEKYQVFSDNQIEARYLITTSFMERFQNIKTAYLASKIYGAFFDKYLYIAPYCVDDLFSLAHLSKTLIDEEQYEVLFNEFASILALVDHFKLDKKLGL